MLEVFFVFHLLIALMMIGVVLLQRGEDAGAGGTAGNTMFGVRGGRNPLTTVTTVLGFLFFANCIVLAVQVERASNFSRPAAPAPTLPPAIPEPVKGTSSTQNPPQGGGKSTLSPKNGHVRNSTSGAQRASASKSNSGASPQTSAPDPQQLSGQTRDVMRGDHPRAGGGQGSAGRPAKRS